MRLTKCRICRNPFQKRSISHKDCSPECAIEGLKRDKAKKARKEYLSEKQRLKSRREWLADVQTIVNKFARLRDAGQPCISCQRHHTGQNHAGHYLSTGAHPSLRYDLDNINLQCQPCNTHLSGNVLNYRNGLIAKIGIERVEKLEGPHDPKKWTISELRELKQIYAQKIKEMGA